MSTEHDGSHGLVRWPHSAALALGASACVVGVFGLLGWVLEISALTSYVQGALQITPNVALAISLSGVAIILETARLGAWARWCSFGAGLLVLGLGTVTLFEYLAELDLGIDGLWLVFDTRRMAPNTALALVFMGWSVIAVRARHRRLVLSAQVAATACALVALLLVAGYLYGARAFAGIAGFTRMALPTAIALAMLALGSLLVRPDVGLMAIVTRQTAGGSLIRHLLLPAILLPALVGGVTLAGYRAGLYSLPFAEALSLVMDVILLGVIVWRTALKLERIDRARRDAELEKHHADLLAAESQRTVETQEDILAIVSHDLRSPLNVISLSAAQLARSPQGAVTLRASESIRRATERMDKLITDLVDFASIRAGTMRIEQARVDAAGLLEEAIRLLQPAADAKGVKLLASGVEDHPIVYCDRHRVLQVLANVVGNSIKFTPAGGRIELAVVSHGREIELTVRDTGPGIAADQVNKVFDRFWKGRGPGAGAGLGLAIAKAIVEIHSGRIWVESAVGVGTAMHFTLPAVDCGWRSN
jgi:signal transduction histidine kinase